jgi:hypothetical protein
MTRKTSAAMSKLILAGGSLAVMLAGVGCGPGVQPKPAPATPPPPDPEMARKEASAKFQQELVMAEVGRTHPVLGATLDRDLPRLQAALAKSPVRVNEVRRDLHLGPPLREACRLRWKEGITELLGHGGKCLGDAQCESCVRAQGGTLGGSRPSSSTPGVLRTTP